MIKRAYAVENIHEGQNSLTKFPHEIPSRNSLTKFPHEINAMTDFTKFDTISTQTYFQEKLSSTMVVGPMAMTT